MSARIIDAHTHLTGTQFDPEALAEGDRLGVTTFLCSCIADYRHYPTLDEVVAANSAMAAVQSDRIKGYCYVNPRHGAAAMDDLARCIEDRRMIGIKLWVATL